MRRFLVLAGVSVLAAAPGFGCKSPAAGAFGTQLGEAVFRAHAVIRTFPVPLTAASAAVRTALEGQGVRHGEFLVDGEVDSASALDAPGKDGTVTLKPGQVKVSSVWVSGKTADGRELTVQVRQKAEGSEVAALVGTAKTGNDPGYCNALLDRVAQALEDLPNPTPGPSHLR